MSGYWEPVERQWQAEHLEALQPLLSLVGEAHELLAYIATHSEVIETPQSQKLMVERLLARRLGEELRAVEVLARVGHGLQAISGAANLFEQSHTLTYVGADQKNVTDFLNWTDPRKTPTVRTVVITSGRMRGWDEQRTEDEYEKYRSLCGFKHNNPFFLRILRMPGDSDLYLCQLALADSIWFILSAFGLFAVTHFSADALSLILTRCSELMDKTAQMFPKIPSDEM